MKFKFATIWSMVLAFLLWLTAVDVTAQQGVVTSRVFPYGIVNYGNGVDGSDFTHHIDGYVRKLGSGSFLFPTGNDGVLRPFAATADGTHGAYFKADPSVAVISNFDGANYMPLPSGAPFPTDNKDSNIRAISNVEYWDINGHNRTTITLTWNEQSNISSILNGHGIEKLMIVGWNGDRWEKISSAVDPISVVTNANSTINSGSISTDYELVPDHFNIYSFGVEVGGALPVELISFKVFIEEGKVILRWETGAEKNFDYFEIEKSSDGKQWLSLGKVDGNKYSLGSSHVNSDYHFQDLFPVSGTNLYRIKMHDLDRSYAYSGIKSASWETSHVVLIYPNPVSQRFFVKSSNGGSLDHVNLYDSSGRSILSQTSVEYDTAIDVSEVPNGMYFVRLRSSTGFISSYPLVIKNN
jgi:hypothetical protein